MPARRLLPIQDPITITLDGEEIPAERGESLAAALVAADRVALARSTKLHRPRGPYCLRGGCDGCAMRVDGQPNVLTCLTPTRDGAVVTTQNVLGSRTTDLLRVTDWFFPRGIDHHHLLVGVPGVSSVMQRVARRVSGLGHLPDQRAPARTSERRSVHALVVGGGPSGLGAASALRGRGEVLLVDDGARLGGSALALGREEVARLVRAHPLDGVELRLATTAAGVYERDGKLEVLVVDPEGAHLVVPERLVLATGVHEAPPLVPGNDLPGMFGARAAATLAAQGIAVGERIGTLGEGPFVEALRRFLDGCASLVALDGQLASVLGSARVGGVELTDGTRLRLDAVVVEGLRDPAFELAEQAGLSVRFSSGRFVVEGAREGVVCVGEAAGGVFDPDVLAAGARDAMR